MDDTLGLRMRVESAAHGTVTCIIPTERDPRRLLAPVTGKLMRFSFCDGALVRSLLPPAIVRRRMKADDGLLFSAATEALD